MNVHNHTLQLYKAIHILQLHNELRSIKLHLHNGLPSRKSPLHNEFHCNKLHVPNELHSHKLKLYNDYIAINYSSFMISYLSSALSSISVLT